jgi:hypothetical protein
MSEHTPDHEVDENSGRFDTGQADEPEKDREEIGSFGTGQVEHPDEKVGRFDTGQEDEPEQEDEVGEFDTGQKQD